MSKNISKNIIVVVILLVVGLQLTEVVFVLAFITPSGVHPTTPSTRFLINVDTTTTSLRYKDDDEDSYPIPVGRVTLVKPTTRESTSTVPITPRIHRQQQHNNNNYDDDDCFYPIPLGIRAVAQLSAAAAEVLLLEPEIMPTIIIATPKKAPITTNNRKPLITQISGFQEFCDYLQEDDRLTVVKFYAPWCKSCQKLGMNLKKVISEYGDTIHDRKKIIGPIRFAQVEYSPRLESFISNTLQISGIPTIQLYQNINKLWDKSGITKTKELVQQIEIWKGMDVADRIQHAQAIDDGVLQAAIDDSFYDDYPDFLEEEW